MVIRVYSKVISCDKRTVECTFVGRNVFVEEECAIESENGKWIKGEVIGINDGIAKIEVLENGVVASGNRVFFMGFKFRFPLRLDTMLGNVIDCYGNVLLKSEHSDSTNNKPFPDRDTEYLDLSFGALTLGERKGITEIFPTKIKAIDSLFTIGIGQRLGLFAPAGAGKTVTMAMMANNMDADYVIFAMIGERAREVVEFVEGEIGGSVLKKAITIVSTSEAPPLEKVRTANVAISIAQRLMREDKKVIIFFDSLTRFARAKAVLDGTPIRDSIPIGVSLALSELVEGCGNCKVGSITGIFTVLIEKEIDQDPIAHEVKSLIDGHVVLSTAIASEGRYPAIDILTSKSRLQPKLISHEHLVASNFIKELLAAYYNVQLLLRVGEYQRGNDHITDEAIDKYTMIIDFLKQDLNGVEFEDSLERLLAIKAD